jgi:hypothetical protein
MPSFARADGRRVDATDTLGRRHIVHPFVSRRHVGICKTEPSRIVLKVLHRNGAAIKNGSLWSFLREGDTVVLRDGDAIALHVTRPLQKDGAHVYAEHTLTFCADPDSDETVEED